MHILIIHQAFSSLEDAGGTRHYEMARYLREKGHEVTVIASPVNYLTGKSSSRGKWIDRQVDENGIEILRAYTYAAWHRSFFHRIITFITFMVSSFFAALSVRKVDFVWGTSPPIFQGITAWLAARLKGALFLFEVRDLWPEFAIAVGVLKNPVIIYLSRWLEKFLYSHADQVIVNSPGYLDYVKSRGARSVRLIPNGADVEMFQSNRGEEQRKAWGVEGKKVVLYAGAHGISNDLGVVLDAANILRDRPDIAFVLVGDGKEKDHLMRHAAEMGLNNVYFEPPVTKKGIADVFAGATICLAILKPLEWYKTTYPNKVFDAMAAGKPVLLCIDGVIRELVEKANAGRFVTPGDPEALADVVKQMVNAPEECEKMGHNGKELVKRDFSRSVITASLLTLLEDMRSEHGRDNSGC
ncbi:glycosyltransferase WbuB [Leptolinea sp. HRD-7]|nr:glycosyltransferase WbuB [Leptolinea sp. HRD-7]